MKALNRYRSAALFDLLVSIAAILIALVNKEIFVYASIAYFAYLAIDSLRSYLSLNH